ncbi:MAG TPA: hypothetical protein VG839_04965 [Asticcacaulis sp.]|nr:hypothetical protein [Asticcacaulis sp.]
MPRISGGTNMVGQAYEPQVTPWDRDDDDVSVLGGNRSRDRYSGNEFGRDDPYRHNRHHGRDRDGDVYDRRDLTPTYGQDNEGEDRSRVRRQGYAQYDPARPWVNFRERERDQAIRDARYSRYRDYARDEDADSDRPRWSEDRYSADVRGPQQGRR